jgi:hypothetical protein
MFVLTVVVSVAGLNTASAQESRSIVPSPRTVAIEPVDPMTKAPKQAFCIGMNAIDMKLTNNTGYRQYVTVVNRDTNGVERSLFNGWLESGTQYLSKLMQRQFELTGPAGTELLRVDINQYGKVTPGQWVSLYVQNCGGPGPIPGGYAQVWASVQPYAIEQGKKGTVILQTSVTSQANMRYYVEILNSWGQLWKRLPINKMPYDYYQIVLPVGTTTKPAVLTYTVKLWLESGYGEPRNVGVTYFSFRVITPGSTVAPYQSGYPTPYDSWYSDSSYGQPENAWPPMMDAYGSSGMYSEMPYSPETSYGMPSYGTLPYSNQSVPRTERAIE